LSLGLEANTIASASATLAASTTVEGTGWKRSSVRVKIIVGIDQVIHRKVRSGRKRSRFLAVMSVAPRIPLIPAR
jgi:hypothetical protein